MDTWGFVDFDWYKDVRINDKLAFREPTIAYSINLPTVSHVAPS